MLSIAVYFVSAAVLLGIFVLAALSFKLVSWLIKPLGGILILYILYVMAFH